MQHEVDWIIKALARDKTKTKTGLAAVLKIDKSGVSRLLRGDRRLKFDEAQRAADYLGVSPGAAPQGFAEPALEFTAAEAGETQGAALAPLYASAAGSDGLWRLDRRRVVERRQRAPQFAGAALAFGFYAPDEAMAPRFFTGETIWANPSRPAAIGQDAVILPIDESSLDWPMFVCRLEAKTVDDLTGYQYGSGEERRFPSADWRAIHIFGRE